MLNCKFFQSGSLPLWRPPPAALWADPNLLPRRGGMASTGPGQHSRGSLQGRQRKDRGDDMLLSSTLAGKTYRSFHKLNLFLSRIIFRQMAMQPKTKSIDRRCNKMCLFANLITGDKATLFLSGKALFLPLNGQKMPCILNHLAVIYLILQKRLQKCEKLWVSKLYSFEIQHSGTSNVSGIWLEGTYLFGLVIMSQVFGYFANIFNILPQNEQ